MLSDTNPVLLGGAQFRLLISSGCWDVPQLEELGVCLPLNQQFEDCIFHVVVPWAKNCLWLIAFKMKFEIVNFDLQNLIRNAYFYCFFLDFRVFEMRVVWSEWIQNGNIDRVQGSCSEFLMCLQLLAFVLYKSKLIFDVLYEPFCSIKSNKGMEIQTQSQPCRITSKIGYKSETGFVST